MEKSNNTNKRKKSAYFVDKKLLPRVREFLDLRSNNGSRADVDEAVTYLQNSFPEYRRLKQNSLRTSTSKAFNVIRDSIENTQDAKLGYYEDRHLRKRQKRSRSADNKRNDATSSDDSDDKDEFLFEYKDTNAVNNIMSNLYKNKFENDLTKERSTDTKDLNNSIENMNGKEALPESNMVDGKKSLPTISEDDKSLPPSRPSTPSLKQSKGKTPAKYKEKLPKFKSSLSSTKFKDIGGCDDCINNIGKLVFHLKHPEVFRTIGIKPPRGMLLHGPPGCGKTLLANAIAGELQLPYFKIASTEVVSGISGETEQTIRSLFQEAITVAPSILFIDEIDSIASKRENAGKEMEKRIVTQILSCLDELSATDTNVLVIGASNRIDNLDPALRRAGRFDHEIALGMPDRNSRNKILKVLCRDLKLSEKFDYDDVALKTPGFVGADLQSLIREAALCAINRSFESIVEKMNVVKTLFQDENNKQEVKTSDESPTTCLWLHDKLPITSEQLNSLCITNSHFDDALPNVQPSSIREGFATVPDVTWKDIGALENIREELRMAIMAPVQNPLQFEALGLTSPPGILLVGPPGCGKTLLAKAVANEAGINFISVKGPELLNMYVGESERAVRQVFERARNSSPCVVFFDEIDALCPRRSGTGESTASSRVVNQLLTEMDGLIARKQVFIMGATNRPDILDRAILRPGRLDKSLYVGLPNESDRVKILNAITKNGKKPSFDEEVTVERMATDKRAEGFSGADLRALVREASIAALKDHMSNDSKPSAICITVKQSHIETAFNKVQPSVAGNDRSWYDKMKERHG